MKERLYVKVHGDDGAAPGHARASLNQRVRKGGLFTQHSLNGWTGVWRWFVESVVRGKMYINPRFIDLGL